MSTESQRQPSPTQTMTNVQLANVEYLTYLGSLIKSDANLLVKWNPGLPRQKKKDSFHQKTGPKIFKKGTNLHLEHSFTVQKLEHFGK